MKKLFLMLAVIALVGCNSSDSGSGGSSGTGSGSGGNGSSDETLTISGSIDISSSATQGFQALSAEMIETYSIYCVAFNADADSCTDELDSEGNFSCSGIPVDTPFGCFIRNGDTPVATFEFTDDTSGFGDEGSTSVALNGNVNLGELTYTEGSDTIEISRSVLEDNFSEATALLEADDLHNTTWSLECVSGDCGEDETGEDGMPPSVFFRIVKASVTYADGNSESMTGLGVWASQTAFENCGEIDITDALITGITQEEEQSQNVSNFEFTQVSSGESWTSGESCPRESDEDYGEGETDEGYVYAKSEDDEEEESPDDLENYWQLDKLTISGNSFTLYEHEEYEIYQDCSISSSTTITFSPTSTTEMYGNFQNTMMFSEGCESEDNYENNSMVVKFTKQ